MLFADVRQGRLTPAQVHERCEAILAHARVQLEQVKLEGNAAEIERAAIYEALHEMVVVAACQVPDARRHLYAAVEMMLGRGEVAWGVVRDLEQLRVGNPSIHVAMPDRPAEQQDDDLVARTRPHEREFPQLAALMRAIADATFKKDSQFTFLNVPPQPIYPRFLQEHLPELVNRAPHVMFELHEPWEKVEPLLIPDADTETILSRATFKGDQVYVASAHRRQGGHVIRLHRIDLKTGKVELLAETAPPRGERWSAWMPMGGPAVGDSVVYIPAPLYDRILVFPLDGGPARHLDIKPLGGTHEFSAHPGMIYTVGDRFLALGVIQSSTYWYDPGAATPWKLIGKTSRLRATNPLDRCGDVFGPTAVFDRRRHRLLFFGWDRYQDYRGLYSFDVNSHQVTKLNVHYPVSLTPIDEDTAHLVMVERDNEPYLYEWDLRSDEKHRISEGMFLPAQRTILRPPYCLTPGGIWTGGPTLGRFWRDAQSIRYQCAKPFNPHWNEGMRNDLRPPVEHELVYMKESNTLIVGDRHGIWRLHLQAEAQRVRLDAPHAGAAPAQDTSKLTMQEALVAHWRFDEGQGDRITDSVGTFDPGRLAGQPRWIEGVRGTALQFEGADDLVELGNPDAANVAGPITLAAWVKCDAGDGHRLIVIHKNTRLERGPSVFLKLFAGSIRGGRWNGETSIEAQSALPAGDLGQWVHLATTYDGHSWRLYRNAQQVAHIPDKTGARRIDGHWFMAGLAGEQLHFKGAIDELQLYMRALTSDEIATLTQPDPN